jgi:hypothetical protein
VKVELDVEGLPAPPLPGDALGRAGVPGEVTAAGCWQVDIQACVLSCH